MRHRAGTGPPPNSSAQGGAAGAILAAMIVEAPHILVVDDDTRLRNLLRKYLSDHGFRVTTVGDAAEARAAMRGLQFDLLILDVMMPGETGVDLARAVRKVEGTPILMLTARTEVDDRIAGLQSGADDYLSKPFEPRELLLRINAILRRAAIAQPEEPPGEVHFGSFAFDPQRGELRRQDERIHLTTAEASLLRVLAANAGAPVSREQLTHHAEISGNARTVDVQVTRLRRKIETDPKFPRFLQTVRGKGYVLYVD
jgi:two-component system phosphate regulon response regulator OmpR